MKKASYEAFFNNNAWSSFQQLLPLTSIIHPIQFLVMNQPKITQPTEKDTRRKLLFGISLLSLFPLLKFGNLFNKRKDVISCAPEATTKTVRMLTEDGRLVEVDIANIAGAAKEKISHEDLLTWVKKDSAKS